jgi:cyclic peptide transporter
LNKITFLSLFKLKLKVALPILAIFAIVNGVWSSGLLILINHKISDIPLPFLGHYDWLFYMFLMVSSLALTYYFRAYMIKVTLNFGKNMILQIIDKLRMSSYESYLLIGEARVRTAMQDIGTLESFPEMFVTLFNAVIMILAIIGYMFWVYPQGAIMILVLIAVLSIVYIYRNRIIEQDIDAERDLDDAFMRNYNDFLHGFSKIKMSSKRSDTLFFDYINKNINKAVKLNMKSSLAAFGNSLMGQYSFFIVIGIVLFVLPTFFEVDKTVISGFMVALLFIMGPLTISINAMQSFIGFKVALKRINEFNEITTANHLSNSINSNTVNELPIFDNLIIRGICYHYKNDRESITFRLEPVNLKINKGEVIFISGGNGSGKSTFINLLAGLYIPKSGEIHFNDMIITNNNRSDYRNKISCIFSDNYLFTENYDNFNLLPSNENLVDFLKQMGLDGDDVIQHDVTNNKIFHNLSSGQRKRLALVYSLLEDKDIFIFDEWAAEQDPEFRKYFYECLIPDLKSKGKTVIAITHDDAYFKFCDRLIKFVYGKMLESKSNSFF